ncbi:MAG: hypothetical protein Q4D14_08200, partial [Bacteroidales bacterium]|nr:hypothetical protein [Bacteroidales bacterium]
NVSNYGVQEITRACGCEAEEHNTIWFKWTVATSGTMGFILTPTSSDLNEDYDFWVFGPNPSCGSLGYSLRCSTTNPQQAGLSSNQTGMNSSETDLHEGPGSSGNSFVKWLNVNAGENYYLVLDRAVGYGSFSLQWTGSATILNPFENEGFDSIPTLYFCGDPQAGVSFDFTAFVNSYLQGHNPQLFSAKIYANETDATLERNQITGTQNIYERDYVLRLNHATAECFDIQHFNVVISSIDVTPQNSIVSLCKGDSVTLEPSGNMYVTWNPMKDIHAVGTSYVVKPDSTQQYIATSYMPCVNLVTNGDFEKGNKGFTSGCTYNTSLAQTGTYTISSNPNALNANWASLNDHTKGNSSGHMLVANGNNQQGSVVIWQSDVPVTNGVSYNFSAYVAQIGNQRVQIEMRVDGNLLSSVTTFQKGYWQNITSRWTSSSTKNSTIQLLIANNSASAEVAIDDIDFSYLYKVLDTFNVDVLPSLDTIINHQICIGDSYQFDGRILNTSGTYVSANKNIYDCDSIVTLNLSVGPFLRRESDIHICSGESYIFRGKTYNTPGVYRDTFPSQFSCDSLVTINLFVHDDYYQNIKADLCFGEEYHDYNFDATQSGHYE